MANAIAKSVGKNGNNDAADVRIVQERLNAYVSAKLLGSRSLLPVDGSAALLVPYIEDFQRLILGRGNPDGRVDPLPGGTMTQLLKDPFEKMVGVAQCNALALSNIAQGPVGGVAPDLWNAALNALIRHSNHPKLTRWQLLTVVDFRLSRRTNRLWAIDLDKRATLHNTLVAHGGGPKDAKGNPVNYQGDFPDHFEDGMKYSSLGAYITAGVYTSDLGHLNNQPAMKIIGLEKGVNGRAQERGVVFHGADYVKSTSVGNSWGCFASPAKANPSLVADIKDGSFVFAYHDSYGV